MDTTQVIIHFIGIVLFTTGVPNDPGLHAILPAIRHTVPRPVVPEPPVLHEHAAPTATLERSPVAAPAEVSTVVEPHIALLIFHQDLVANDSQWPTLTIQSLFPHATSLASYKYVELTGEHITFMVDAPSNDPPVIPKNMPRFSCVRAFGRTLDFTSEYQWPYAKAAAVVDIPKGRLSVCEARRIALGRIDTRLVLNTSGTLTVIAVNSDVVKTLVLRTTDDSTISVVNAPPPRPKGSPRIASAPHFDAYRDMIDGRRTTGCSTPKVDDGAPLPPDCENFQVLTPPPNAIVGIRQRSRTRGRFQPPVLPPRPLSLHHYTQVGEMFALNAECSNTQWP